MFPGLERWRRNARATAGITHFKHWWAINIWGHRPPKHDECKHVFVNIAKTIGFSGKCLVNVEKPHAFPW